MIKAYAAFEPGGELEPFEFDPGPLGTDEVEIDVHHCGICHSDLSILDNAWGITEYPLVPGHEVIGTVASVGSEVSHLTVGETVGLGWHAGYCMACDNCLSGDHNLCINAQPTIVAHHGGFADKVRARAVSVVPLPAAVDPTSAGPLFCGGITVFNPLVQFGIRPTDRVGVVGIGGLGHLALQFLAAWGCEVTAFTSSPNKRDELLELGARHILDSRDPAALEAVADSFDLILSTVNVTLEWNKYLGALKPKGRLHIVGATLEPLAVDAMTFIAGQRTLSGSPVGSPATIRRMLEFAARHRIRPLVEYFRFDQVNEALAHLRSGKARYRVVLSRSAAPG
jgi:uncharacterized zinc-type alcohol dehydrogenase-like protein